MIPLFKNFSTFVLSFFYVLTSQAQSLSKDQSATLKKKLEITIYPSLFEIKTPFTKKLTQDKAQIFQKRVLAESLQELPGVTLSRLSPEGSPTHISIRGARSNQTKVFLLGIELNEPCHGYFDFSSLASSDISSLQLESFSNHSAIGGSIELIPNQGKNQTNVSGNYETGSYQSQHFSSAISGPLNKGNYFLSTQVTHSGTGKLQNSFHKNEVSDQLDANNITIYLTHPYHQKSEMALYFSQRSSSTQLNQFNDLGLPILSYDLSYQNRNIMIAKNNFKTFNQIWNHEVSLARLSQNYNSFSSSIFSKTDAETYSIAYLSHLKAHPYHHFTTTMGLNHSFLKDYKFNQYQFTNEYGSLTYKTNLWSYFVLECMGRLDYHHLFKNHKTYYTKASYFLKSNLSLFAAYGRALYIPSLFDFYQSSPLSLSNPDLKPMFSQNLEIGSQIKLMEKSLLSSIFTLSWFRLKITDLIITQRMIDDRFQRINQGDQTTQGIESRLNFTLSSSIKARIGYTYTQGFESKTHLFPVRLSPHQLTFGLEKKMYQERLTTFTELIYYSPCSDLIFVPKFDKNQYVDLPSRYVTRVGCNFLIKDNITVTSRIENFLDRQSYNMHGIPQRGLSFFLGLRFNT